MAKRKSGSTTAVSTVRVPGREKHFFAPEKAVLIFFIIECISPTSFP